MVTKHFGMENRSFHYLALYDADYRKIMENLKAIIETTGMKLQNVVKCSCFLSSMDHFVKFNAVYDEYFKESLPARETVEVGRLPKDMLVEVSAICGA